MADVIRYLVIALGFVNMGLLLGLLRIYVKSYQQVKSEFTIGLVFFASLVLLETVFFTLSFIAFRELQTLRRPLFPMLIQNILRCVAYSILLKISWE